MVKIQEELDESTEQLELLRNRIEIAKMDRRLFTEKLKELED
jgi:hypothetical protein